MSNLKRIREKENLTQSKLAEVSGVNLPMIQKYEAGIKDINKAQAMTLYKLAQALNCIIEDLLEWDFNIGDMVYIRDSNSIYNGEWGIIKRIDGDDYYIAINNGTDSIPVFNKDQFY